MGSLGLTRNISIDLFSSTKYHGLSSCLSIFGGFSTCSLTLRQVPSNKVQVPEQYQLILIFLFLAFTNILVPAEASTKMAGCKWEEKNKSCHPEKHHNYLKPCIADVISTTVFDVISTTVGSLMSSVLL